MALLIGTRGSQLALTQAEMVRKKIAALWSDEVKLEVVKTLGDRLSAHEAKEEAGQTVIGLFTKELDEALLSGQVRAAIHSLKDVPTVLPQGIQFGALIQGATPQDALITRSGASFAQLPSGAKIGTSSPRREAQLKAARPDLILLPLRGNVDTRLRKLKDGEYDAIVIAAAGLQRLGRDGEITQLLDPATVLPAPAQGVLCVTIRENDEELLTALKPLHHIPTWTRVRAERSFLRTLQGGCRVPVGALASIKGTELYLEGVIAHTDGKQLLRHGLKGSVNDPEKLGEDLAQHFLNNGAQEILSGYGRGGW